MYLSEKPWVSELPLENLLSNNLQTIVFQRETLFNRKKTTKE